jgi:hypothetical protein
MVCLDDVVMAYVSVLGSEHGPRCYPVCTLFDCINNCMLLTGMHVACGLMPATAAHLQLLEPSLSQSRASGQSMANPLDPLTVQHAQLQYACIKATEMISGCL